MRLAANRGTPTSTGSSSLRNELTEWSGRRGGMDMTHAEYRRRIESTTGTHWAIVRVYRPPKLSPLPEPQYVMGDDGPLLFELDRQKDAVRWKTHLGLGQRSWKVVKVRMGEDEKLRQTFL